MCGALYPNTKIILNFVDGIEVTQASFPKKHYNVKKGHLK